MFDYYSASLRELLILLTFEVELKVHGYSCDAFSGQCG